MSFLKPIAFTVLFGLLMLASGLAHADDVLEQWRGKAGSIRQLLENDVPRAYAEAERLQAELPADATPSDRVRLLNLLARIENYQGETAISAAHAQQAFDLAKQHEDKAGQAEADITIALDAVNQGNIDAMIAADTHSLTILDGVDRPDLLAEAMFRGSGMYNRLEMLDESVAIAVQAMEIAKRGNDDWVLAYAYQGMAAAYDQNGRHAEARDNYAEMLKHARAAHSKILEGNALIGIGTTLNHLGDHQEGERSIRASLDLYRTVGAPFYITRNLFALAESLRKQGRLAEALPLLDEAVVIYRQRSNKIGLWWTLFQRSENYLELGKITQADADAQHAYRLAQEIKFPVYLAKSARRLSEIHASRGDYRQAYRLSAEADKLSVKAVGDNAGKRMLELTQRYQTESKQREIDKLNRRNQQQAAELNQHELEQRWLWTVLGGSIIVLVGTAFFLIRLRRSHRRLAKLNTQALQAKNKLQATLDTIPDLLFELGLDGRYYDYHSPRTELLAASAEYLLGKTVPEVMPADASEVCMSALREAHENGTSAGKQFELALPHGDFWFELSVACKPAVHGEEPRFIVLSRDITERKQMEEALRISRQILTEAQRIAHIGSWELDLETNILTWSDEIFRIFEIDRERFGASYEAFIEVIHPDDREAVNRAYVNSVKNREPYEIEHRLLMADGRIKHVLERCETRYSGDGKPLRSLGTVQDITERKHMEAQTLQREQEFRVLVEHSPDLIFRYDKDCRRIYANPAVARLVGMPSDALLNSTPTEAKMLSDEEADRLTRAIRQVLATGRSAESEVACMDADGLLHYFHNRYAPEFNAHGDVVGVISIARDITERKQAADALAAREREFRTLAESLPDNVIRYDREGRVIYVNPVLEKTLDADATEMLGTRVRELFPNGEYDDYAQLLDRVLADGESGELEKRIHSPDGQLYMIHNIRIIAERGDNGEVISALAIGRDITERKLAEDALRDSEEKYRTLVEKIQAAVVVHDADTRILVSNQVAQEILGLTADQLHGKTAIDPAWHFYHEDGRRLKPEEYPVNQVLASCKELKNCVLGVHCPDRQEEVWVLVNAAPVFGKDGAIIQVIVTFIDITERKRAEHDIALMSQAMGKVREATYLMGDGARFLYVNDESCRALGYSRGELLTMSVMDIGPGWTAEMVEAVLQRPHEEASRPFEAVHRRKDGSTFPVEITANQFEYDGKIYGLALVRDITERKLAENEIRALNAGLEQRVLERTEELRRQTHYLRTLIDTLPMLAWLKDKDSRFLVVNQTMASACALTVDDMIGKSDLDCWSREYAESYRACDVEVMATGRRKTMEEAFVDAHNNLTWIETFKAPVLDVDGSVLGTVGIARDIGDRRAMEQARESALAEAERLAQLRSEFMARMSHELRTPLNGIMGYAQILLGENRDNERHRVMLNVIQQSGEYLLNLINDILDFAKIEAGKQELSLSNIQLPRFLNNLVSIVTIRAEQKGLVFVCDIAAGAPAGIRADETRLRQVLLNLLSNAVKYSEQGQVSLRVAVLEKLSPEEGAYTESVRLRFEVQDNGVGIDTGQLETIFQAFEQAGDWQHRTGGTGLGLPISRELVRIMGSDIHVISQVGEGSTFWFDLEVSVVDGGEDSIVTERPIVGYHGLRRRVLVVDDVNENRALLIDILSRLGFETFEAASGRACLDSVEAQMPDLILLDMVMPEMDGLETARRLRRLADFERTPIIAVSASASDTDVTEAMSAGVSVFLSKPIDITRLMVQLAALLKLDWIYEPLETGALPQHRMLNESLNEPLVAPPLEEMAVLYRLAQEGSMRDISRQATYLEELDPRYRPFAAQLRALAQGYQSKAILDMVERYIDRTETIQPQSDTDAY